MPSPRDIETCSRHDHVSVRCFMKRLTEDVIATAVNRQSGQQVAYLTLCVLDRLLNREQEAQCLYSNRQLMW